MTHSVPASRMTKMTHSVPGARLRELLAPRGAAFDLAVFRITVAVVIAWSGSVAVADHWAALPQAARVAPLGVGWLLPDLPITPDAVRVARVLLWGACVTGAIGLFSRVSFALVALLSFYVLLAAQLGGAVFHDHHLLWFAILLAAAPCGDALSVDAWLARRRGAPLPTRGRAHGAAIRSAWALIGFIFLFPGLHKLSESGLDWITSDNLRNQLWWKWAQDPSTQPAWRVDRYPMLLRMGAALTVALELSFLPLVFARRTRALAVAAALAFHAATDMLMGIDFSVLWVCYTVFVPWEVLLRRVRAQRAAGGGDEVHAREDAAALMRVGVASGVLLLGVGSAGAAGAMQAYPFACYPTFQWMAADRMPALAIELEDEEGVRVPLDASEYREPGPRAWALEWRLVGEYDGVQPARIDAWWEEVSRAEPLRARMRRVAVVHFYRVSLSVDPDRRGEELERVEIYSR